MTTPVLVETLTADDARDITEQIKVVIDTGWHLVARAYQGRAWAALGYSSWDDYCTCEFAGARLRLPREDRQEVVASLRDSGLSTRAIAAATGQSQMTVVRDLAGETNDSPAPVTGMDGKIYQITRPESEPELTPEEREAYQREVDRRNAIRRHQDRLRELINGWVEIPALATNPNREAILAGLIPPDRERVLEIEDIYQKAIQT